MVIIWKSTLQNNRSIFSILNLLENDIGIITKFLVSIEFLIVFLVQWNSIDMNKNIMILIVLLVIFSCDSKSVKKSTKIEIVDTTSV